MDLLAQKGNMTVDDERFPYRYDGIDGPFITLKRIKASMCKVCRRIHEHEHPYLFVVGPNKDVYFDCRRHPKGQKLHLGNLSNKDFLNDDDNTSSHLKKDNKTLDETTISIGTSWAKDVISRMKKLEHLSQTDINLSKIKLKPKPKITKEALDNTASKIFQQAVQKIGYGFKSGKIPKPAAATKIQVADWDDADL
jgi:hypothetical protein